MVEIAIQHLLDPFRTGPLGVTGRFEQLDDDLGVGLPVESDLVDLVRPDPGQVGDGRQNGPAAGPAREEQGAIDIKQHQTADHAGSAGAWPSAC